MTRVFGGTFDPPHDGHVAFLEGAERHFGDEPCWCSSLPIRGTVRSWRPPSASRSGQAGVPRRGRRARRASAHDRHAAGAPVDDPVLLIGSDQLADFPSWKEPEAVLDSLVLLSPPGPASPWSTLAAGVTFFEIEPSPVSSTEIRRRVAAGEPIDGLVPPAVAAEIARLGLYRDLDWAISQEPNRTDFTRTSSPHRRHRPGEAGARRRHPRYAAGVHVHRLLRDLLGRNPRQTKAIYDEVAYTLKKDGRVYPARSTASARRRGSSPTTSTSSCTSSRRRRAPSTSSRTSGPTCPPIRWSPPPPDFARG